MKKQSLSGAVVALLLLSANVVYGQPFQKTDSGVKTNVQSMDVEIQFYSPSIVRVIKSPENKSFRKESLSVIKSPEKTSLDITQTGDIVQLKSKSLLVELKCLSLKKVDS